MRACMRVHVRASACMCVCVCSSTLNIYRDRVLQVNNVYYHDIIIVHEIVYDWFNTHNSTPWQ